MIEEVQRLLGTQGPRVSAHAPPERGEEATPPQSVPRERTFASADSREQGYGPYASQGARRVRGCHSPDPFMFNDTIFLEHDSEASAARDDPMRQLQSRLMCVEHNIETLRTRLTQVVDLRDTQGIRQDHCAIVARLDEVEEYASANTFREFMTKIQRLESMLVSNGGGTVGEAIRVCTRRIDQQQASLDDVRNRMRAQDGIGNGLRRTPKTSLAEKIGLRTEDVEGAYQPKETFGVQCLDHSHHRHKQELLRLIPSQKRCSNMTIMSTRRLTGIPTRRQHPFVQSSKNKRI